MLNGSWTDGRAMMQHNASTAGSVLPEDGVFGPDLVVIGAMRAGTTSLHNLLVRCSGVSLPKMKETDFFIEGKNWSRGFAWYQGLFSPSAEVTAEVSPNYSKRDVFKGVPQRLASANPNTRIVYLVRDPVARAISHYRHSWLSSRLSSPDDLPGSRDEAHILASSRYAYQIGPWLEHFPAGSVLVVEFTELVDTPLRVLRAVARHAGFEPPESLPENKVLNASTELRRMPPWWQSLRESRVGTQLRSMAPGQVVRLARKAAAAPADSAPPPLPDHLKARFAEQLAPDAERFRKLTGRSFATWSV